MAPIALSKGDKAPDFTGLDQQGKQISLADFAGKKLILFFYPKDNTPGCTAEACNLRDHYQELTDHGFALLGVSPDSAASHQKFISKFNLPFPLIADTDQTILKAYGAWGEKSMYGKIYEGVLRSTFVISDTGHILLALHKVNTKDHTAQILTELGSH
jgi:peroxiredoxin Q/BCP